MVRGAAAFLSREVRKGPAPGETIAADAVDRQQLPRKELTPPRGSLDGSDIFAGKSSGPSPPGEDSIEGSQHPPAPVPGITEKKEEIFPPRGGDHLYQTVGIVVLPEQYLNLPSLGKYSSG